MDKLGRSLNLDKECVDFYSITEDQTNNCVNCEFNHICKQEPKEGLTFVMRCPVCNKLMNKIDRFALQGIGGGKGVVEFYVCWDCQTYRRKLY